MPGGLEQPLKAIVWDRSHVGHGIAKSIKRATRGPGETMEKQRLAQRLVHQSLRTMRVQPSLQTAERIFASSETLLHTDMWALHTPISALTSRQFAASSPLCGDIPPDMLGAIQSDYKQVPPGVAVAGGVLMAGGGAYGDGGGAYGDGEWHWACV